MPKMEIIMIIIAMITKRKVKGHSASAWMDGWTGLSWTMMMMR
jgi:hypothetical protein